MTATTEIATAPPRSAYAVALLRLAVVALVVTAIVATFIDTLARARINQFNFFGFFTMQSNIITVIVVAALVFAISRLQVLAVAAPPSIEASGTRTAAVPEHDHQG